MFEIFKVCKKNFKENTAGSTVYKFDKFNAIQLKNGEIFNLNNLKKFILF